MNTHTLEAALGYSGAAWNAGLTSSYTLGADLLRTGSDNRVKLQTVTASLRPLNTLTITPTLGYRTEQQDWSGVRVDSPSASLAMNYQQSSAAPHRCHGKLLHPTIERSTHRPGDDRWERHAHVEYSTITRMDNVDVSGGGLQRANKSGDVLRRDPRHLRASSLRASSSLDIADTRGSQPLTNSPINLGKDNSLVTISIEDYLRGVDRQLHSTQVDNPVCYWARPREIPRFGKNNPSVCLIRRLRTSKCWLPSMVKEVGNGS